MKEITGFNYNALLLNFYEDDDFIKFHYDEFRGWDESCEVND